MDDNDVKDLSELYELQELVVGSQRQLLDRLAGLSAIMGAGEGGDPTKSAAQDLKVSLAAARCARSGQRTPLAHGRLGGRLSHAREQPGPR